MKTPARLETAAVPAIRERHVRRIAAAAEASHSPATLRNYRAAWSRFVQWCGREGPDPLPAAPESVAAYLAERAESAVAGNGPPRPVRDPLGARTGRAPVAVRSPRRPPRREGPRPHCRPRGTRRTAPGRTAHCGRDRGDRAHRAAWAMATFALACGGGTEPEQVSIPDRNLRTLIAAHLGKVAGSPIHEQDMLTLRALVATPETVYGGRGIGDLQGLQYATNLEELDVSAEYWDTATNRWNNLNDLSDLSPLAGLTKLKTLDLSGSNSSITDISLLSGLPDLRRLDLWNASVSDLQPLASLTELEFLDLTSNDRLSDLSPLSGLTNLRDLRLSYNAIGDITPLANVTSLVRLNLSHNRIDDLTALAALPDLEILSVSGANLSDLAPLVGLGKLVYLSAGSCTRWLPTRYRCGAPPDLTSLSGLKGLQALLLHDNNISDLTPFGQTDEFAHIVVAR